MLPPTWQQMRTVCQMLLSTANTPQIRPGRRGDPATARCCFRAAVRTLNRCWLRTLRITVLRFANRSHEVSKSILQVALHYVTPQEVWVTFVTGSPQTGVGVPPEQAPDQQPHPPHVSLTRSGDSMARTVPACVLALPLYVQS